MTPNPRLLLIADIGGEGARHIGDEAMLEANLGALRALFPQASFTVVVRAPEWLGRRYGVAAIPAVSSDAVASCHAVILSGGGNLASSWPDLLRERVTLLELAHRFGKPSVVLGQTIGPHLSDEERQLLAATLPQARFVGVRELPSAMLAISLGVPPERIWYQFDDALRPDEAVPVLPDAATIAVTIDPQLRATGKLLFEALAAQLRTLADATGARLVLVPHAFGDEGAPSDLTEARLLAAAIGGQRIVIDVDDARSAAASASLVISSRYHPIVFGLLAGVPSLGIYGDDYCRVKLQGALAHAGLERWTLTYDEVASGRLLEMSRELWASRESIRQTLDARMASWRAECGERWAAVRQAITGEGAPVPSSTLFGRPVEEVLPRLASAFAEQRQWSEHVLASSERRHRETQLFLQRELGPRRTFVRYLAALRRRFHHFCQRFAP